MNRPERHNAFDETLIEELTAAFAQLDQDPRVRAVVLAGRGKSFSAGADLNWMRKAASYTVDENLRIEPGVRAAGTASTTPLSNNFSGSTFAIPGRAPEANGRPFRQIHSPVSTSAPQANANAHQIHGVSPVTTVDVKLFSVERL